MDVAGCFSSIQATEACDTHELTLQQPTLSHAVGHDCVALRQTSKFHQGRFSLHYEQNECWMSLYAAYGSDMRDL
jgi:hypothetical protein